jgi:hypothetical protein
MLASASPRRTVSSVLSVFPTPPILILMETVESILARNAARGLLFHLKLPQHDLRDVDVGHHAAGEHARL